MATKSTVLVNISPDGQTYLRMNGGGITTFQSSGGGEVNCQWGNYTWEAYAIISFDDGTFGFESNAFSNRYLRNAVGQTPTVNCQYWDSIEAAENGGTNERYLIHRQDDGTYYIESNVSPGNYLNIDGGGNTSFSGPGFGTVSVSTTPQKLFILPLFGAPANPPA